ncbi:hypothetical protein Ancab_011517 [Ancistrocladus abbreviatus]
MDQVVDNSASNSAVGPGVFIGGLLEWSGGPTDNVGSQGGMNPVACTDKVGLAHNHMASNSLPGSGVRAKFKKGHVNRNLRMGRLGRAEVLAVEIWEMGKQLGFSYTGGKNETLVRLNEMEDRDRAS